jgi:hypothetical protein
MCVCVCVCVCQRLSFCLFSSCDSVTKQASSVRYVKIIGSRDGVYLQWVSCKLDIRKNFSLHDQENFLSFKAPRPGPEPTQ